MDEIPGADSVVRFEGERTLSGHRLSALGRPLNAKIGHCVAYPITSSAPDERIWHRDIERFGSLEIDNQLDFDRLLDGSSASLRIYRRRCPSCRYVLISIIGLLVAVY